MIQNLRFIHILTASLVVEMCMLFLFKFTKYSSFTINQWYQNLGWTAVILDVVSIIIGFYIAKFIYQYLLKQKHITPKHPFLKFLLILLIVQIIHDFAFYFCVIKPSKVGKNTVIDEFKKYAKYYKTQAVVADSLIYIFTTPLLYFYISHFKDDVNTFIGLVSFYIIGYLLHQKNIRDTVH